MSARSFWTTLIAGSVWAIAGCGARTTLDDQAYLGAVAAGGSGLGSGATGPAPGGGSGSVATAGSSFGGAGGAGMRPGPRDRVRQACERFCESYAALCPGDYASVSDCARQCTQDLAIRSPRCRDLSASALDCLTDNLQSGLDCSSATLVAFDACVEQLDATARCSDDVPQPPPPSPACSHEALSELNRCDAVSRCPEGNYAVACYSAEPGESTCTCKQDIGESTTFVAEVPIENACEYARIYCNFP